MTGATRIAIRQFVCATVLATMESAFAQPPVAVPVPDDRAVSVGDWDVVAVEWNGKPVDPEFLSMLKVHFEADGGWSVLFKGMPAAAGRSTNRQDLNSPPDRAGRFWPFRHVPKSWPTLEGTAGISFPEGFSACLNRQRPGWW